MAKQKDWYVIDWIDKGGTSWRSVQHKSTAFSWFHDMRKRGYIAKMKGPVSSWFKR